MNMRTMIGVSLLSVCGLSVASGAGPNVGVQPPADAAAYEAPPRPTDGTQMALTVEKLEKGLDPERPLLIWAIGSSFTNFLGDVGSELTEMIRPRFPNMPKIVYKKMVGSSTTYHFTRGWARHLAIPDQPDVVLIYNFGDTKDLEQLILELRRHTTADIIVPTLHWSTQHKQVWPQPDARNNHQDPAFVRAVCQKYGVEFVENRDELTRYMIDNKLTIESLLLNSVHQTPYTAKMIVMNIARHFNRPEKFGYDPRSRERRVQAESSDVVKKEGNWLTSEHGAAVSTGLEGSSMSVTFTGNRIDLIGWRLSEGGSADILIDGAPADQAAVFYASYILPDPGNFKMSRGALLGDCSPHRINLGAKTVPQKLTITMTSDKGDYDLVGSVTGLDGSGNAKTPMTSKSGQIVMEPTFWRWDSNQNPNRKGDKFTFKVYRCATGRADFKGEKGKFRLTLIQNMSNGQHTLKLVAKGDGQLVVDAFDVFEPPLRD